MNPVLVFAFLFAPDVEVRVIEVDMLETNTVTGRFVQTVAWDREETEYGTVWVDRGYAVLSSERPHESAVYVYGDCFRAVKWCNDDRATVIESRVHLVTETACDREAAFRSAGGRFRPCW